MGCRRYLVLLTLLAGAFARAEPKDSPVVPPPMAQPQDVSIFRGHNLEIPLRAQGRAPGQLKFLIRSSPSKGRLGEIRLTGPKTAEVTYFHDGDSEGSDSFTFAVQAVDSPVSAAAPITIVISEEAPALSTARSVSFGTLEVGTTRVEEIVLRNSGGGKLEGQMEAPPPWEIVGSAEYRMGRNEEQRVQILCKPVEEQEYFGKLVFSHDARAAIDLTANAISPFEFSPSREIELATEDAGASRSGGIVIRNRTARDRTLEIKVPAELAAPDQLFIPAGGEEKIALSTKPGFLGALETAITFESKGFKRSMPVRVFALAPILRIEPREGLDFGQIETRKRYRGFLHIKNEGGSAARLRSTVPAEILLVPDPNSAVLQPGETRVFEVAFEASAAGSYRSEIVIASDGGKPVTVPVFCQMISAPGEAKKISTGALSSAMRPAVALGDEQPPAGTTGAVKDVRFLKAGNGIFEVAWEKPKAEPVTWIVQQRLLETTNAGPPGVIWRDLTNVRFFDQSGMVGARFENLAPGQVWFLRIVSLDDQGRRSAPSPTFMLASPPARDHLLARTLLTILAVGAAVLGLLKFRQRRHAEDSHQAEQIARLEGH